MAGVLAQEYPSVDNATPSQQNRVLIRSNLSILGAFLHIIRERFSTAATDDFPWAWVDEPQDSKITIELAYSENAEQRGKLPAIYIGKTPTSWSPVLVGDRAGTSMERAEETKMMHANTVIIANVVARNMGECFILADIVSHAFLNASDFLREKFNYRDIFNVTEGAPTPYPKETTWWQIPISVNVEFTERWAQQEGQTVLSGIRVLLPTGEDDPAYYTKLAITSLG